MLQKRIVFSPLYPFFSAKKGNHAATEIHGIACIVYHKFGRIGILNSPHIFPKRFTERGNLRVRGIETPTNLVNLGRMYERFITLYVDNHVILALNLRRGLLYAICPTQMVGSRHDSLSAKILHRLIDTFVVRSHVNILEHRLHLIVDPLYDRFSAQ